MKAIPLQHIPRFHGLTSEDLDAFLFEFDVLCRGYDYTTDPQKLKLFPSTLKGAALIWFMGLGGGVINNQEQMKESFLKKCQDYCKSRELKDEIFQMIARPNETLEEYVERFQSSRGSTRTKLAEHDRFTRENKIPSEGVTRVEIGSLFENFKTDILGTLTTQLDVLQAKQNQMEAEQNLALFCPRCRKKHSHKECPLDTVQTCAIYTRDHSTESCPSLLGLKAQNPQSNLRPQLPAQPNPNPNNRVVQALQILETLEEGPNLRECNDLQLRSGHIIQNEGNKIVQIEDQLPREHLSQEEDVNRQKTHNPATTSSPLFPERLVIPRPIQQPNFDILGELQNLYIKIPFLQAIQDIPIYAKTIKELCIKRPRRNIIDNPRVQVVDTLSDLLSGKETPIKYEDPGNPIVTVQIYNQTLPNALVDLGAAINILTTATCQKLGITSAEPTSTLLELADRSVVRLEGILHDVMVSVDSWEYPTDFLIINPKT
eukprot:PITA_06506